MTRDWHWHTQLTAACSRCVATLAAANVGNFSISAIVWLPYCLFREDYVASNSRTARGTYFPPPKWEPRRSRPLFRAVQQFKCRRFSGRAATVYVVLQLASTVLSPSKYQPGRTHEVEESFRKLSLREIVHRETSPTKSTGTGNQYLNKFLNHILTENPKK